MKNVYSIVLGGLFFTSLSSASIVETKYRVISRYYDEMGQTHKLVNTRVYIRYNDDAQARSIEAKQDCLVTLGGKGVFQLTSQAGTESCVSDKEVVMIDQSVILRMMDRAASFQLWDQDVISGFISLKVDLEYGASKDVQLENTSMKSKGVFSRMKSSLRSWFGSEKPIQLISTKERTVFVLSSLSKGKFSLELEPLSTEILTH